MTMTRETFRRRIEAAEQARGLGGYAMQPISIGAYTSEPTLAFRDDFKCRRREGESIGDFTIRAHCEARAFAPRAAPILIFVDKEISHAA